MNTILFVTAAAHIFYSPFTKVEESFNLQAMHDILYLRHNFTQYDHHEFPGVVPRTFLGPLFVSILSTPMVLLFDSLQMKKFWTQYVVRLILAAIIATAWERFRRTIAKLYGIQVSLWFTLITVSQFHFMFYMSRPLPNIMALPLVLYAISSWLKGESKSFIILSGVAVVVFRSELILFLGLLLAFDIYMKRLSLIRLLKIGLPAGVGILASTVIVDSFFWQRIVWPEGEVLWYNTILNKSSDWGTSPFLWYFYSALPRAMGLSLLLLPFGIFMEPRIRPLVVAAFAFVFLYSFLPHKELRFIIYVFPIFNLTVASACHRLWINSGKSLWQGFLALFAGGHILLNIMLTIFLLVVSGTNYPGGVAMSRLHRLENGSTNISLHISNLAAQSGISRFMEIHPDWIYSKNESLKYTDPNVLDFSYLLVEAKSKFTPDWNVLQEHFEAVEYIDCFSHIGIQYNSFFPIAVKTKPCVGIMRRRKEAMANKRATKSSLLQENENIESIPINLESVSKAPVPIDKQYEGLSTEPINDDDDDVNDGVVITNDESAENFSVEESSIKNKEINFQELRNLALGKITKKTKATKLKLREIIEQHYRSKGSIIENDPKEQQENVKTTVSEKKNTTAGSVRQTVKSIIRQEKIKEMIDQISKMDLTKVCDLNKISTKDCLKRVIDDIDNESNKTKSSL